MSKLLRQLDNPELDDIKINIDDHFELVYLRHRYFRKSTNPSPERLNQFEQMICNISDSFYRRNAITFKLTGFEKEDIRNIMRFHTVSFISMCGLRENEDKFNNFRKAHKKLKGKNSEPGDTDIFLKESYNLSIFLKQRAMELVKKCESKNENIRGSKKVVMFFVGKMDENISDTELVIHYKQNGYKKINATEFKKLQKKHNAFKKDVFFIDKDTIAKRIEFKAKNLTASDIEGTPANISRGYFYRDPCVNLILEETLYRKAQK